MDMSMLFAAVEPLAAEGAKAVSPAKVHQARALIPAFAGIVILGFAMIGLVWWTAYMLRRRLRRRLGPTRPVRDAWYQNPSPNQLSTDIDEQRS